MPAIIAAQTAADPPPSPGGRLMAMGQRLKLFHEVLQTDQFSPQPGVGGGVRWKHAIFNPLQIAAQTGERGAHIAHQLGHALPGRSINEHRRRLGHGG